MHADFGYNVERIPLNGVGTTGPVRAGSGGAITAVTTTTLSSAALPGGVLAGDIIITSTGFWGVVAATPVGATVTVDFWRKPGGEPMRSLRGPNEGGHIPTTPGGATWKAFSGSVLASGIGGFYLNRINIIGVAASTLVITDCDGTVVLNVPSTVASPWTMELVDPKTGLGIKTKGPFTITPSNAAILGNVIFTPA